jgi:glutathione S-transferase
MITLGQFADVPGWGFNASPFCSKVETYLRLAGLPFRIEPTLPMAAPKGKLPFIIDEDGTRIPDSGQIIAHLEATRGARLDGHLTPEQRALGHLIRRTCEESLYFVLLYSRWFDPAGWRTTRPAYFAGMPAALRGVVPELIRRRLRRDVLGQGILRHSPEEIYALGCADLDALAVTLGGRPFFLTDRPGSVDAVVHAFVANILKAPVDNRLKAHAQGLEPLVGFVARLDGLLSESDAGHP